MKIRTDFVTNSSSSNFLLVLVELDDKTIQSDEVGSLVDWNFYMSELEKIKNMEDLIHVLDGTLYCPEEDVEDINYLRDWEVRELIDNGDAERFFKEYRPEMVEELRGVKDFGKLRKVVIQEGYAEYGEFCERLITESGKEVAVAYRRYDETGYDFEKNEEISGLKRVADYIIDCQNGNGFIENYKDDEEMMKVLEENGYDVEE